MKSKTQQQFLIDLGQKYIIGANKTVLQYSGLFHKDLIYNFEFLEIEPRIGRSRNPTVG